MIKHQFFKYLFLFVFSVLTTAFADCAVADGVSSLRDFFNNTNTMRAKFSQVVTDTQGRKVQEVEGTMQLQRPNKFCAHSVGMVKKITQARDTIGKCAIGKSRC